MPHLSSKQNSLLGCIAILTINLALSIQIFKESPIFFLKVLSLCIVTLPLHILLLKIITFRFWSVSNFIFLLDGLFMAILTTYAEVTILYTGFAILIFSWLIAANIFLLPAFHIYDCFQDNQTKYTALMWSFAIILAEPIRLIWEKIFHFSPWIIFLITVAATFIIRKPTITFIHHPNPLTDKRISTLVLPSVFLGSLSAFTLVSLVFLVKNTSNYVTPWDYSYTWGCTFCLIGGVLLAYRIIEKYGIFTQSILLIFNCEIALFFIASLPQSKSNSIFVAIILMYCIASLPLMIPNLCIRFFGHVNSTENLALMWFSISAGSVVSLPAVNQIVHDSMDLYAVVITLLIYLSVGLGCFFSAWKHRFIILQSSVS